MYSQSVDTKRFICERHRFALNLFSQHHCEQHLRDTQEYTRTSKYIGGLRNVETDGLRILSVDRSFFHRLARFSSTSSRESFAKI